MHIWDSPSSHYGNDGGIYEYLQFLLFLSFDLKNLDDFISGFVG